MTSRDTRLDKLADNLTARERALLVLRSWKEGRDEDPAWRWRMPAEQFETFNRYVRLMHGVNYGLFPLLLVLSLEAEKIALRIGILATLALWYVQWANAEWVLELEEKKPDLDLTGDHVPRLPVIYIPEELREAVAESTRGMEPTKIDEAAAVLKERLHGDLQEHWRYLLAAEAAVAEVESELGEDPALPDTRRVLDYAREQLAEAREEAERYLGPLADVAPDDELLAKARRLAGLDD